MTTSSNAAWQEVVWKDLFGDLVNLDITQIDWSYNGSTVTSGSVAASFAWRSGTGWIKLYSHKSGYVDSAGAYYFGNTWSGFKNSTFCFMLPTVYTYYYHNKLWGYPNGTAVRSQSSDSIDECAPLHVEIYSEYGHII